MSRVAEQEFKYLAALEENDVLLEDDDPGAFTPEEVEILRNIKSGKDITSVHLCGDWYRDDHEICQNLEVNGVKIAALWIVPEFFADLIYAAKGIEEAKEEVAKYILSYTEDYL